MWSSPNPATPKTRLVLDFKKGKGSFSAQRFDFDAPPVNPMGITIDMGNDKGEITGPWTQKKNGLWIFP
jgi:hypothetical protein